jgi:hypothetical protein
MLRFCVGLRLALGHDLLFLRKVLGRKMELLKPKIKDYPGKHIELKTDNTGLDLTAAKDIAKQKANEICDDPMLLS